MQQVQVPLGSRSYQVLIARGLLDSLGMRCRELGFSGRCAIISDKTVADRYAPAALKSLSTAGFNPVLITVPPGEKSKSIAMANRCYIALAKHQIERRSLIVALGGGVTGDLAGFVAATYLRGLPFVQVPTTLLAQVDSSVGGKVGVNLPAGKNLVGSFLQPKLVLCDLDTLVTLPDREFRAGLAEVIKYGIIRDRNLFNRLERDLDKILARHPTTLAAIIASSCQIKAEVVAADETESGLRAILNFGHTIGHAIEAITTYGRYLHGEAISIGQVAATRLSSQLLGFPVPNATRVEALFQRAGLPVAHAFDSRTQTRLLAAMRLDKKVQDGAIRFVLVKSLGDVVWGQAVQETQIRPILDSLRPSSS